ncbi:thiamine-phosphate kinase [Acidocella sp.]|uniref:thiamine-phosphate kinase n=1 Tax=Acidocella sp. TaxID=50710 RepID=UPI002625DD8C|nr:thiamine-phosphate kinase [Acidocella sp.]
MAGEFDRIARYFAPLSGPEGLGLRDDAALLTPPPGVQLVLTVDQMLESVHFLPGDDPALIARKLLRRNLSDLAAMGAAPLGYLLTTALPVQTPESWLARFAEGLATDQARYGISLMGGDSSSSKAGIALSITAIGAVPQGAALTRAGARAGDEIWVTGTIGDAILGLKARLGEWTDQDGTLTSRSLLPTPRLGLALHGLAHACIDISDGLVQDLGHIAKASGLAATIQAAAIPTSPEAARFGDAALPERLTGGDDYELLLAVPPGHDAALRAACGAVPVTRIGQFTAGQGVRVLGGDGADLPLPRTGWAHF